MSKRKREIQNRTLNVAYRWDMENQLFSMFDYTNLPFRKEFLEWELMRVGMVAIGKDSDNDIVVGGLIWTDYDKYGLPKEGSDVELWTRYGYRLNGKLGKDIVIGYNNPIRTPELLIPYYAELFTEIDKSIKSNVIISRCASIPVASNDRIKTAIENILTDIENGETRAIASESILDDYLRENNELVQMLHLTQPEQIERVQYLSKLFDDLHRRFWCKYGVTMNTSGKMAQINELELKGNDEYSNITPYTMLESRKELFELCNNTFGTNISVDFGKAWQHLKEEISTPKKENEESEEDYNVVERIHAE